MYVYVTFDVTLFKYILHKMIVYIYMRSTLYTSLWICGHKQRSSNSMLTLHINKGSLSINDGLLILWLNPEQDNAISISFGDVPSLILVSSHDSLIFPYLPNILRASSSYVLHGWEVDWAYIYVAHLDVSPKTLVIIPYLSRYILQYP